MDEFLFEPVSRHRQIQLPKILTEGRRLPFDQEICQKNRSHGVTMLFIVSV